MDKNAHLEWLYGKIEIDKTEMNDMIESYLHNFIEPSYKHLYYQDHCKGKIWYDYNITMQCIQNKRDELTEQLWRLNNLEYLMMKNSFPEKYKEYLFKMLKNENSKFYEIMNKECKYQRGTSMAPYWNKDNAEICPEYCTLTSHGIEICKSCKYYLDFIKEYKELTIINK